MHEQHTQTRPSSANLPSANLLLSSRTPKHTREIDAEASRLMQMAFRMPALTQLQLPSNCSNKMASDYLAHHVARYPADLRSHIQHINLHIQAQDGEAVYGALLDLFIVLGERGKALRERMLTSARNLLQDEHYSNLQQHLGQGITELDAMPLSAASVLSKNRLGTQSLIEKDNQQPGGGQDPLDEARDHLEYGQVDEARKVLENAILRQPERQQLHHDLLEIYQKTNNREAFRAMRGKLDANRHPAMDAWRELAMSFTDMDDV